MESKLAQQTEQKLISAAQQLAPEQRIAAFVTHCRLVNALWVAGMQARQLNGSVKTRASV